MLDSNPLSSAPIAVQTHQTSRRAVLTAAAWSVPVIAASVAAPLANASGVTPLPTDLVLRFGDVTGGSTTDISNAVISFIEQQIRALGPQPPVAPELVLPPRPTPPSGAPWNNPAAWAAYAQALAQWTADTAAANADYATEVAAYLEALARYSAWDLAVTAFISRLRSVATQSEGLFFASVTYPRSFIVRNEGPGTIPAGTAITTQVLTDINLVNVYLPQIGPVTAIQTGGTTTVTYTTPAAVAPGQDIYTQDLEYNPVAVTLGITGTVTPATATVILAPSSQDTDVSDNGDVIVSTVGVVLNVATGDVQAILAEWRTFLDQAIAFYELVSPFLPEIDWNDIISGLLPLPTP